MRSVSSATNGGAKDALQYYGYNSAGPNNFTAAAVQQSIKDKRPVYISGQDEVKKTGHAWVIEGVHYYSSWGWDWIWNSQTKEYELGNYSSFGRTMYRCNWGWGGRGDEAVYSITALAPVYSNNSSSGYDFSKSLKVLTNIRIN